MVYAFEATRWIYPKGSKGIINTKDDTIVSRVKGEIFDDGLTYREVCGRIAEEFKGWNMVAVRKEAVHHDE